MAKDFYELTTTERKVFNVLIDIDNFGMSKIKIAEKAGVSRPTLDKILKNKNVMMLVNESVEKHLAYELYNIKIANYLMAKTATRDGFNDRKLFLELQGAHQESLNIKGVKPQIVFDLGAGDSEQEKKEYNTEYYTGFGGSE